MVELLESRITNHYKTNSSSQFNPWTSAILPSSHSTIDRFEMPKKWQDIVKLCSFFYEREGLVRSVIDKQVELAINSLNVVSSDIDEEYTLYKYVANNLLEYLSVAATEYYISGLVVPEIVWGTLPKEISGLSKDYIIPTDIWTRDPSQIDLKTTPLPNHVIPVWTVPAEDVEFIQSNGKYLDGTEDKATYEVLKNNFPEFVANVKKGETKFPLVGSYVIRRKPLLRTPYPVPYLLAALELLVHKRNLRAMDYALVGRVIDAILHVRIGNDQYPLTEDDEGVIDALEQQFNTRYGPKQRLFQLFTNHTVELEWVIPNLDALLDTNKYDEINREILYSLGFPKFLVTGEKDKSNTGSSGSALLSPVNSMKSLRKDFINFVRSIFIELKEKNSLTEVPHVSFAPLNLIELNDLLSYAPTMEQNGVISKTSLAELAGFDFKTEMILRSQEQQFQEDLLGEDLTGVEEELNDEENSTDEQD